MQYLPSIHCHSSSTGVTPIFASLNKAMVTLMILTGQCTECSSTFSGINIILQQQVLFQCLPPWRKTRPLTDSSWHEDAATIQFQGAVLLSSEWYRIVNSSTRIHRSSKHPLPSIRQAAPAKQKPWPANYGSDNSGRKSQSRAYYLTMARILIGSALETHEGDWEAIHCLQDAIGEA